MRYAKYAIVGSIVAAVGATALGPVLGTAAFVVAPPTIVASIGVGMCWGLARWGWRRMGVTQAVEKGGVRETERAREGVSVDGGWRDVQGPRAVPYVTFSVLLLSYSGVLGCFGVFACVLWCKIAPACTRDVA